MGDSNIAFNWSSLKESLSIIRRMEEATPVLVCSPSQKQFFIDCCNKENINLNVVSMPLVQENTAYIMTSSQLDDIYNKGKKSIEKIQDERMKRRYHEYLLNGLFMDMDDVIDAGPPLTFDEFCEKECEKE